MKQALTYILTILLLPLAVPASILLVALMLAMLALVSPVLVFGGAFIAAGKLANTITDWLYPPEKSILNPGNGPVITSLSLTALFSPLLVVPVAVGAAATTAVVSILFVPAGAIYGAYTVADKAINKLFAARGSDNEAVRVEHSYSKLPENLDEDSETTPKDVPHFDFMFQKPIDPSHRVGKSNVIGKEKSSQSEKEVYDGSLVYTSSYEK